MSADNEKRLEQILSELRPGKRNILQDHINELSGKERDDFIQEVIKEYEAAKNAAQEKDSDEPKSKTPSLFVQEPVKDTEPETKQDEGSSGETTDIESGIVNALKVEEPAEKEEKPKHLPVTREPADEDATSFTKAPMHTKRHSKGRIPVIIICSLLAVIAAFGLSYIFFLSKNAAFIEFASNLGIQHPSVQTESVTTPETTTEATTAAPTPSPTPTPEPTPTPVPTPTEIPTPTPIAPKSNAPNLKGVKVVIDPGHQAETSEETEACATWLSVEKPRCTAGGVGVTTGIQEYG